MPGDPNILPIPGPATEAALPQQRMVTPAEDEEVGEHSMEDGKQGGTIYTCQYSGEETRPQAMHGSVHYQEETADPGEKPKFYAYTDLTMARGEVKG